MALSLAYAKLQLDPEDGSRVAAFEALCWQHIFNHASHYWIIACRNSSVKLQLWTSNTSNTQGFKSFDSTLDDLVFEFVHAYATAIWPVDGTKRSHLALLENRQHGMELKATHSQLDVFKRTKQRFKVTQDLDLTARDAMVESEIGQRVRVYLMNLLLSNQPVPDNRSADAEKLLQSFLDMPTRKRVRSDSASAATDGLPVQVSSKRIKREKQSAQTKASQLRHNNNNATDEPSAELVRLRFTFSGAKWLQRILSGPIRPTADLMNDTDATSKAVDSVSAFSDNKNTCRDVAAVTHQCWLPSCGKVFRTTKELVLHVDQEHTMECREAKNIAVPSDTVANRTSQHPPMMPEPELCAEHGDIASAEVGVTPEQTMFMASDALLQSLQDAEEVGFAFDDQYVAMIKRYASG
jgi:uncharacterized C2H2 Zn-finger protein